ncbi:MAG: hypothetical protein K6W08_13710 [Firmicutes bacterium]|nr:hypothetical protein [Bacillota bacterium]
MTAELILRVEQACLDLLAAGEPVTFPAVAARADVTRAVLYRHPELRAVVEEHRQHGRAALTLTGITVQLDQLRATVEALAAKVRRHDEHLRRLKPRP